MRESIEERFWNKVDIKLEDECWEWLASTSNGRYGKLKVNGKFISSHRLAYQLTYGNIEDKKLILHKCDNMRCCNPKHLYQGTPSDNMYDREIRNPLAPELAGYGKSKLYAGEIWLIRKLKGIVSSRFVGKMFKVNQMTIVRVWNREKFLCKEGYYA